MDLKNFLCLFSDISVVNVYFFSREFIGSFKVGSTTFAVSRIYLAAQLPSSAFMIGLPLPSLWELGESCWLRYSTKEAVYIFIKYITQCLKSELGHYCWARSQKSEIGHLEKMLPWKCR